MTKEEETKLSYELAFLPCGTIVQRTIRGAVRFYHQWRENGKTKSKYLKIEDIHPLRVKLDRRKTIKKLLSGKSARRKSSRDSFSCAVMQGERFLEHISAYTRFPPREEVKRIADIIGNNEHSTSPVFIYGNAGTGKTTMLCHVAGSLNKDEFEKSAFITLTKANTLKELCSDIETLKSHGTLTFLIDNLSALDEWESMASLLCDFFASQKVHIVFTGTIACSSKATTFKINHLPQSAVLKNAFSSFENARMFFCEQINNNAFDALVCIVKNLLWEESNTVNADNLVNAGFLHPCPVETLGKHKTISTEFLFTNPDLLRVIGTNITENLLTGKIFAAHGASERKRARETLLETLEERILEQTVLLKMILTQKNKGVISIKFSGGSRAFVIANEDDLSCELFTVRNKKERDESMLVDLATPSKLDAIEHRYGLITKREVLYLGRTAHHPTGIIFRTIP